MTCGGTVTFYFEPQPGHAGWTIAIFGAGHVAQALVPVVAPLECRILVCDPRADWLARLPTFPNLTTHCLANPADLVPALPDDAFVLCMTQGHATDRPILLRCLTERQFPYLGAIGSAAKAAVLRRELVEAGVPADRAAGFHCPIGLDFGSNHPHEIALSIAAHLLTERDRLAKELGGEAQRVARLASAAPLRHGNAGVLACAASRASSPAGFRHGRRDAQCHQDLANGAPARPCRQAGRASVGLPCVANTASPEA